MCVRSLKVIGHDANFLSLLQTCTCMKAAESTSIVASGCELETLPVVKELWGPNGQTMQVYSWMDPTTWVRTRRRDHLRRFHGYEGSQYQWSCLISVYPEVLGRVQDQVEFKHLYHTSLRCSSIHPSIHLFFLIAARLHFASLFPVARHMIFSSIQTQNLNLPDTVHQRTPDTTYKHMHLMEGIIKVHPWMLPPTLIYL